MSRPNSMRPITVWFTLCAATVAPLDGQATSCPFDTAAHLRLDTVIVGLAPGPRIGNKHPDELRAEYLDAAVVIREHFRPPARVALPLWARLVGDSMVKTDTTDDPAHGFDGDVRFRLDDNGRLTADDIAVETLASDLAESVLAAIRRADSAAAFAPPSRRLRHDRGTIRLHFATPRPGSPPMPRLVQFVVPALRVDKEPSMEYAPLIHYPDDVRLAGITGRVLVQVVIGSDGRPIPRTMSVLQGEYRGLVSEVIDAVPGMRFRPARIDTCDVPVLVRLPVDFKIMR